MDLNQYLQLLNAREIDMSEEDRNTLENEIHQNPNILLFYLQLIDITDPNYARYRAFMPSVIIRSMRLNSQQFYENGSPYLNQIIQCIIQGKDLHFMTKICTFFIYKNLELFGMEQIFPQLIQPIFNQLMELTAAIENKTATDENIEHAVLIYRLLAKILILNVHSREFIPLFQFTLEKFDVFFNLDFILKDSTRKLMQIFLKKANLVIMYSFDECMQNDDSNSILQKIFQFIPMLTQFSQGISFQSSQATNTLIQIVALIRDLIMKASKYELLFPNECQLFKDKYHQPLLETCINTVVQIYSSYPNDLYRMIHYNILCIINQIVSLHESPEFYQKYGAPLLNLSYIYSVIPRQQELLIDNPSSYYWTAYCMQPYVVPEEPRSFSFDIIERLFRFSSSSTLDYILQLSDSSELMPIFGYSCELLYEDQTLFEEYKDRLAAKAQQLIQSSTCNEDTFYFMTQIIPLLPLQQLDQLVDISTNFLKEFDEAAQADNITPKHQFSFTLACRAIRLLLSIQYTNQNIEPQIGFIIQNCEYCFTADGINIFYDYCKLSDEHFITYGQNLVAKAIWLYAQVTQNFTLDNLDKQDESNIEQFQTIINECMAKHCEIIPFELLYSYMDNFIKQESNDIDNPITEFITIAAKSNYPSLPGLLELYFEAYNEESKSNNTDQFLMPFLIFIEQRTQDFINWTRENPAFVQFIIEAFSALFPSAYIKANSATDPDTFDIENAYYFSNAICMLILIPGLLNDQDLQSLVEIVVPTLAQNQDLITFYIVFDIVTSIIYRRKENFIPDIIPTFLEFISRGSVIRKSDKIRYSKALNIVFHQTADEEMKQNIMTCLRLLSRDEESPLQEEEDFDWLFEQENIGLNALPIPFGLQ